MAMTAKIEAPVYLDEVDTGSDWFDALGLFSKAA